MMNIDLGSTLALLLSLAVASAPVVVQSLKKIASIHKEELRLKQDETQKKP